MDLADQVNIQEQIKEPNQIFINPPSLTDLDEETAAEEKIWVRRKKVFYWKIIKNFLWFIMHIKVFLNTPRKQVFFCNYLKKYFVSLKCCSIFKIKNVSNPSSHEWKYFVLNLFTAHHKTSCWQLHLKPGFKEQ